MVTTASITTEETIGKQDGDGWAARVALPRPPVSCQTVPPSRVMSPSNTLVLGLV